MNANDLRYDQTDLADDSDHEAYTSPGKVTLTSHLRPRAPGVQLRAAALGPAPAPAPREDAQPAADPFAVHLGGEVPHRAMMERAFGQDFGAVRAATGQRDSMGALRAQAATAGEQIQFASDAPSPYLVAHELTHVVQNRAAGVADRVSFSGALGDPDSAAEREAESVAARVAAGGAAGSIVAVPTGAVQRAPEGEPEPSAEAPIPTKGLSLDAGTLTLDPDIKAELDRVLVDIIAEALADAGPKDGHDHGDDHDHGKPEGGGAAAAPAAAPAGPAGVCPISDPDAKTPSLPGTEGLPKPGMPARTGKPLPACPPVPAASELTDTIDADNFGDAKVKAFAEALALVYAQYEPEKRKQALQDGRRDEAEGAVVRRAITDTTAKPDAPRADLARMKNRLSHNDHVIEPHVQRALRAAAAVKQESGAIPKTKDVKSKADKAALAALATKALGTDQIGPGAALTFNETKAIRGKLSAPIRAAIAAQLAKVTPTKDKGTLDADIKKARADVALPSTDDVQAAKLAELREHFRGTAENLKAGPKGLKRAWMFGMCEKLKFELVGTKGNGGSDWQAHFDRLKKTEEGQRKEIPPNIKEGGPNAKQHPVHELSVEFLEALKGKWSDFQAMNRKSHGDTFGAKGLAIDLVLTQDVKSKKGTRTVRDKNDERGFYDPKRAIDFLLAVDAAATQVKARWKVLYNDFSVAEAVNAKVGRAAVGFQGKEDNWHGPNPAILHFHLDLVPEDPDAQNAKTTPAPPAPAKT